MEMNDLFCLCDSAFKQPKLLPTAIFSQDAPFEFSLSVKQLKVSAFSVYATVGGSIMGLEGVHCEDS
jgi:hypothetical protein